MSDTTASRIAYLNMAEYALGKVLEQTPLKDKDGLRYAAAKEAYDDVFIARDRLSPPAAPVTERDA